jgi:hypothetical protein
VLLIDQADVFRQDSIWGNSVITPQVLSTVYGAKGYGSGLSSGLS